MLIYNKKKIFNVFTYLGSLTSVGIEVGGELAPECLCILVRYYVFREGVKTLCASESKGALTCSQSSLGRSRTESFLVDLLLTLGLC